MPEPSILITVSTEVLQTFRVTRADAEDAFPPPRPDMSLRDYAQWLVREARNEHVTAVEDIASSAEPELVEPGSDDVALVSWGYIPND